MKKNIFGLLLKLIGIFFFIANVVLVFWYIESTSNIPEFLSSILFIIPMIYVIILVFILFLLFYGVGTIICLIADIEWNTRNYSKNIKINESHNISEFKKKHQLENGKNNISSIAQTEKDFEVTNCESKSVSSKRAVFTRDQKNSVYFRSVQLLFLIAFSGGIFGIVLSESKILGVIISVLCIIGFCGSILLQNMIKKK